MALEAGGGGSLQDILPQIAPAPAAAPMAGGDIVGQIPAMMQRVRSATPEVGAAMGEISANGRRIADVNNRLAAESQSIKDVKPPELVDMPKMTPQEYRSPFEAFGSAATVLSIFGSMLTRAPLTTAINSAASAMESFHKGDMEAVKLHEQNWRDATTTALEQNKKELSTYKAILEKHNLSVSDMIAELNGAASASNNSSLKAALANGQLSSAVQLISAQESANARAQAALTAHQDRQDAMKTDAERAAETARHNKESERLQAEGNAQTKEHERHNRETERLNAMKGNHAKEAAAKKNDELLAQADDLLKMIDDDPNVVGTRGKIKGAYNTIRGIFDPTAEVDENHAKFTSTLAAFRNEASVALSGSKYYSGPRMMAMAQMLPGLDKFTSAQDAKAGLTAIRNLLAGARNELDAGGNTDDGGMQPGDILDGHRYKGGDPSQESNWEAVQ